MFCDKQNMAVYKVGLGRCALKEYHKYFLNKLGWFLVTFVCAFILNFILPRLMPGDPVAAIVSRMAQGMTDATGVQAIYEQYTELFGTNQANARAVLHLYEERVARRFWFLVQSIPQNGGGCSRNSIVWTIALQFPAIIVGWLIGNTLGALAAYLKGGFDKVLMPVSIFLSNLPAFGMAIILLVIFGVNLEWLPTSGGYGYDMIPEFSWRFRPVRDCPLPVAVLVYRADLYWGPGNWHALDVHL